MAGRLVVSYKHRPAHLGTSCLRRVRRGSGDFGDSANFRLTAARHSRNVGLQNYEAEHTACAIHDRFIEIPEWKTT